MTRDIRRVTLDTTSFLSLLLRHLQGHVDVGTHYRPWGWGRCRFSMQRQSSVPLRPPYSPGPRRKTSSSSEKDLTTRTPDPHSPFVFTNKVWLHNSGKFYLRRFIYRGPVFSSWIRRLSSETNRRNHVLRSVNLTINPVVQDFWRLVSVTTDFVSHVKIFQGTHFYRLNFRHNFLIKEGVISVRV